MILLQTVIYHPTKAQRKTYDNHKHGGDHMGSPPPCFPPPCAIPLDGGIVFLIVGACLLAFVKLRTKIMKL